MRVRVLQSPAADSAYSEIARALRWPPAVWAWLSLWPPGLAPPGPGRLRRLRRGAGIPAQLFVVVDGDRAVFGCAPANDTAPEQRVEAVMTCSATTRVGGPPNDPARGPPWWSGKWAAGPSPSMTSHCDSERAAMDLKASSPEARRRCGRRQLGRAIGAGPAGTANPPTVLRLVLIKPGLLLGAWIVQRLLGPGLFGGWFPTGHGPPDREAEVGAPDLQGSRLLPALPAANLQLAVWIGVIARWHQACFPVSRTCSGKIRDALAGQLASPLPCPWASGSYSVPRHPRSACPVPACWPKGWGWCISCCAPGCCRYTESAKAAQEAIAFNCSVQRCLFVGSLVLLQLWGLDLKLLALFAQCVFGVALAWALQGITKTSSVA